jgi:capsular exopolysaccharide synthesis family protein
MLSSLPVASYLFILRKHLWLVLGTVAVVLGGGWFYAQRQVSVYKATALVQVQPGGTTAAAGQPVPYRNDPLFIADQMYKIKNDPSFRARVLARLQAPPSPPPGTDREATGPRAAAPRALQAVLPPPHDPARFAAFAGGDLPGTITITAVPFTSFYEVSVSGPDPRVNWAVANAYALVFADVFREERERQYRVALEDYRSQREAKGRDLERINDRVAEFEKGHPKVDFRDAAEGPDRGDAEAKRAALSTERLRLLSLGRQVETARTTLRVAGLEMREDPEKGLVLGPASPEDPAKDPRLDERVQSMDVVSLHEGVRRARAAITDYEAQDARLGSGVGSLRLDTEERRDLRQRILDQRRALARNTEAAINKLVQDVALCRAAVNDYSEELLAIDERAEAAAVARAEHGLLAKGADAVRAELAGLDNLILEAERLRQKMEEDGGNVRPVQFAREGEAVLVAPNRTIVYVSTLIAALVLAAGLAYVLEYLDDTVKSREDFDRLVRLPFLGYVPHIDKADGAARDLVVAHGRTGSPEVESFRAIRTGVQFSRPGMEVRTFLITSAGPGEGKTMISVNLASAFAGGKGRVLLLDADLRRARAHTALGVDNGRGLTNVLVGEATLDEAVQRSAVEGLDVLASGPIPPNPAEVLGSERMQEVLREAAARWDRVIVDSPPLVAVTDPALLAKWVDAVFLVISIGKTSIRTIQRARETLATVGATVHGAVLNNADERVAGYYHTYGAYGYGYGYHGYGPREPEKEPAPVAAAKDA